MNCQPIEQRLAELRQQKREITAVLDNLQGAGLQAAQANLANIEAQIRAEEQALADCQAMADQGDQPRPFVARVKDIYCSAASREVGKEEPYVVIGTVDMLATLGALPLQKPAVHSFLVGPWADISKGIRRAPPAGLNPEFWDLDSQPRIVAAPQDVIFLASVNENDGSSPDAIRGAVHSALEVGVINNLNRDYGTIVDTLASAMAGAIDTTGVAGLDPLHLNADDRIGRVQHLELTADDLCTIYAAGSLERELTFTRRNGSGKITEQYTVTFSFET